MNRLAFAKNLKKYRELKGLSKEELGRRVGVSGVTVGYWEDGRNEPRMGKVQLIADTLDVSTDDLLFDSSIKSDEDVFATLALSAEKRKAIEMILSLPEEDVKLLTAIMERTLRADQ